MLGFPCRIAAQAGLLIHGAGLLRRQAHASIVLRKSQAMALNSFAWRIKIICLLVVERLAVRAALPVAPDLQPNDKETTRRSRPGAGATIWGDSAMAEFSFGGFQQSSFQSDAASEAPPGKFPYRTLLERYGLRATRQRLGLARLLFSKGNRHVTADALAAEANALKMQASLATVYNVLNLFAEVGIVRSLTVDGTKTIFDTNTSEHSHFYFEDTGHIEDIPLQGMEFASNLTPPEGYEIVKVDVVVRLRPKGRAGA